MPTPVICALGLLLTGMPAVPTRAGRVGEASTQQLLPAAVPLQPGRHTVSGAAGVAAPVLPDTTRRAVPPDTTQRRALVPDITPVPAADDKPTRKTTLLIVLAIAVLTVSTLLLYNVRSR